MFEVYIGAGKNKQLIKSFDKLNDAIILAWNERYKTLDHHGVIKENKVVFNTNFGDPEFVVKK